MRQEGDGQRSVGGGGSVFLNTRLWVREKGCFVIFGECFPRQGEEMGSVLGILEADRAG